MANGKLPKNQVRTRGAIEQHEHEDDASARRVVLVDSEGSFIVPEGATSSNGQIFNITITNTTQEFSQLLPSGTTKFLIKSRQPNVELKLSFTEGEVDTKFITIRRGSFYQEEGLNLVNKTLYFKAVNATTIVELITWS